MSIVDLLKRKEAQVKVQDVNLKNTGQSLIWYTG